MTRGTPAAGDEAGWLRVWIAAEISLVVGREAAEQDEVGRELLPPMQDQLATLVGGGYLTPQQRAEAGVALGWLGDPRPDVACVVSSRLEIPAGSFLMGSKKEVDGEAYDDEEPQHSLDLPLYKIGKYPVTVGQFRRFVEAGGYDEAAYWTEAGWKQRQEAGWKAPRYWDDPRWTVPNHPVVGVSWYEAVAYCNWFKAETGRRHIPHLQIAGLGEKVFAIQRAIVEITTATAATTNAAIYAPLRSKIRPAIQGKRAAPAPKAEPTAPLIEPRAWPGKRSLATAVTNDDRDPSPAPNSRA